VAIAVLLTAAYWYLLYQPRREERQRYVEQTAQLETERSQVHAKIVRLREIEANEKDYRSQLVRLREYIPDGAAQPETLDVLQQAADNSGVEITQMTYGEPELVQDAPETNDEQTALARIPTQMTVAGGYFQVVDLLRRIEVDMTRAVKVDTVTMAEAEELFPTLSVTWTGNIFAVLPTAEVADVDGAPTTDTGDTATPPEAGATEAAPDGPTDATPDGTTDAGTS
jgi:Tfp pilus assembly protein PilO